METYQSEDIDKPPQVLIFTGAIELINDLQTVVSNAIAIPTQIMPYFSCLPLNPTVLSSLKMASNLSFFNTTSVFLGSRDLKVNLIPEEIKLKRQFEERGQELIKMSIYIICIILLIGGIFLNRLYFKGMYLAKLKKINQSMGEEAQILEKAMERIRIIKMYLKSRGYSLEVLSALYDVMPKEIMLTNIKVDAAGNFYLKGSARAMSNVFSFVSALEASDYFSNVKTNYTTSRKQKDEDWADFGITCVITGK